MSFVIASLIWGAVMASASACLPTCTDSSASLHVELLDGSGELCTLRKRAASSCRFIQSAEPRCALDWLSPAQLLRSIKKQGHRWLLFIGDSDTRGVVLGLLQLLAAAGHTSDVAERSRELWLGDAADSSRLCHLDWSYDERDRVLASRAVPCLGQHKPTFSSAFDAINSNLGYIMFGENYTLDRAHEQAGLRVTYVTTTTATNMLGGLRAMGESFDTQAGRAAGVHPRDGAVGRAPRRPDFLYANAGCHIALNRSGTVEPDGAAVLGGLQAFAREHVGGSRTLVWGTALHHRSWAKLDNQLLPLLPPDWLVLNRRGNGRLASKLRRDSSSGLRLSDGHAPHLVNMVDAQRIFTAVAARADGRRVRRAGAGAGGSEAARPPTCHQTPPMLGYTPQCAGRWYNRSGAGRTRFIEAYQHFCRMGLRDSIVD